MCEGTDSKQNEISSDRLIAQEHRLNPNDFGGTLCFFRVNNRMYIFPRFIRPATSAFEHYFPSGAGA
jgi:hypothetical protein